MPFEKKYTLANMLKNISSCVRLVRPSCSFDELIEIEKDDGFFKVICVQLRENYKMFNLYPCNIYRYIHRYESYFERYLALVAVDDDRITASMDHTLKDKSSEINSSNLTFRHVVTSTPVILTPAPSTNNSEPLSHISSDTTKTLKNVENQQVSSSFVITPTANTYSEPISNQDIDTVKSSNLNITMESFSIPDPIQNLSIIGSQDQILPLNGLNVSQDLSVYTYKDCKILEGQFTLSSNIRDIIIQSGKLHPKYYPYIIRNRINKNVNNTCILIIKFVRYLKKIVKIFAKCKHFKCKKFLIAIEDRSVKVYSPSINYCHVQCLTSFVKGVERSILKKKIQYRKPCQFKNEIILRANRELIRMGNLQSIKSDCVVRKIRSEGKSQWDRHTNDILDLINMQMCHREYVQEISFPFTVKLFSKEQLMMTEKEADDIHLPLLYFDATGSLVEKPLKEMKRVLLYSGVIQLRNNKRVCDIFDIISSEHSSKSITKGLIEFRNFCEDNQLWPIFGGVVTDFSFANVHAILKAFNNQTIKDYLEICMKVCTSDDELLNSTTTIHLCCAHFLKMVAKDVNENVNNIQHRELFKEIIACCVLLNDLSTISFWFENLVFILNEPFKNNLFQIGFNNLIKLSRDNNMIKDLLKHVNQEKTDAEIEEETDIKQTDVIYKSSPFYQRFKRILDKYQTTASSTYEINPYHNRPFLELILIKYMPYCPLWSGII